MCLFFASDSFSLSISPSNEYSGLISLGLTGLMSLQSKGHLRVFNNSTVQKASILQCSAFFIVQLSHPYMTTGKTIALTRRAFVSRVMSMLFNMLSRFVSFSSNEQASFNFMVAVTVYSDFGAQENKICHYFHFFPSICHEVMELDAMIFIFWMLNFKSAFSFPFHLQQEAL